MTIEVIIGLGVFALIIAYYIGKTNGHYIGMSEGSTYIPDQVTIETLREDNAMLRGMCNRYADNADQNLRYAMRHYEAHRRPGDPLPDHLRAMDNMRREM